MRVSAATGCAYARPRETSDQSICPLNPIRGSAWYRPRLRCSARAGWPRGVMQVADVDPRHSNVRDDRRGRYSIIMLPTSQDLLPNEWSGVLRRLRSNSKIAAGRPPATAGADSGQIVVRPIILGEDGR